MLPFFTDPLQVAKLVDAYFEYIEGDYHTEEKDGKVPGETLTLKIWDREPEPPTFAGLAYHIGFNSRQQFEEYEAKDKVGDSLKRGRLRIEAAYERKLHQQSPTGAIFVLKCMGWGEKQDNQAGAEAFPTTLNVNLRETGPAPVGSEKEVLV